MDKSFATREWLDWLTRVLLLTITLILTIGVVWPQYIPGFSTNRFFLPLIIFWITLGILHLILLRWLPQARWHGGLQVAGDVVMISLLVYFHRPAGELFHLALSAGDHCASILFSRRIAFLIAATCFLLLAGMTALAYAEKIPRTFSSLPTMESLRTWLVMNLLGFLRWPIWPASWPSLFARRAWSSKRSARNFSAFRTSPKTSFTRCAVV